MARYKLIIEYDGTDFVGWQQQKNGLSVQQVLADALWRLSGERATVSGGGRTDAGVHALGQVAHVDIERAMTPMALMDGLNFHVRPAAIAVVACALAADDFHARFSAKRRHYLYRIVNRRAPLVLDRQRAWRVGRPLDAARMHAAAQILVGRHDFSSFRAAQCQAKSPVKTLEALAVARQGDEVRVAACARSFLHNQVRAMVGSLKLVGEGKWSLERLAQALAARDRAAAGPTAPPDGLYLTAIDY
jgi:tRNA pseudouridine38-40 synthase